MNCKRATCHFRKYVGQIYCDSLVHDQSALKYLVDMMGEVICSIMLITMLLCDVQDKIVLGSDYPFPLGEHHPGKLIDSILDWSIGLKVCK